MKGLKFKVQRSKFKVQSLKLRADRNATLNVEL